jgi:hypothetical protein
MGLQPLACWGCGFESRRGAWTFVSCECCVFVRYMSLQWTDHSSREVLPTVLCPCVWSRNLKNEEAKTRKWVVKASKRRSNVVVSTHDIIMVVHLVSKFPDFYGTRRFLCRVTRTRLWTLTTVQQIQSKSSGYKSSVWGPVTLRKADLLAPAQVDSKMTTPCRLPM